MNNKWKNRIRVLFILLSSFVLVDFFVPTEVIRQQVVYVEKEKQNYNNAAGNFHYTYKVVTLNESFFVPEEIGRALTQNDEIEFSKSLFFKEVKWCRTVGSSQKSRPSIRFFVGVAIPLLTIAVMVGALKFNLKNETVIFVVQVALVGVLVFLCY